MTFIKTTQTPATAKNEKVTFLKKCWLQSGSEKAPCWSHLRQFDSVATTDSRSCISQVVVDWLFSEISNML